MRHSRQDKIENAKPFPINLQLENFRNFHKITAQSLIKPNLEKLEVVITSTKGYWKGKKRKIYFSANYQIKFDSGKMDFSNLRARADSEIFMQPKAYKNDSTQDI